MSWANGDASVLRTYAGNVVAGAADSLGAHKRADLSAQQTGRRGQAGATAAIASSNMAVDSQQRDALAIAQNGGLSGQDIEESDADGDADGDDGMDDDMMDKISSSPSIEDGGFPRSRCVPSAWPRRTDSLKHLPFVRSPSASPASTDLSDVRSSSPYLESPEYMPWQCAQEWTPSGPSGLSLDSPARRRHHLRGEYNARATKPTALDNPSPTDL